MSEQTAVLAKALMYLECLRKHKDKGPITVTLPSDTWHALYYEVAMDRTSLSVTQGMRGIVIDYPPPSGEDYASGFYFMGCWVKRDKPAA